MTELAPDTPKRPLMRRPLSWALLAIGVLFAAIIAGWPL